MMAARVGGKPEDVIRAALEPAIILRSRRGPELSMIFGGSSLSNIELSSRSMLLRRVRQQRLMADVVKVALKGHADLATVPHTRSPKTIRRIFSSRPQLHKDIEPWH